MTMKIVVCVIYPRYPDNTEPLGGFVESEETARKIDDWWRAQPGDMIGTWEDLRSRSKAATNSFTECSPAHPLSKSPIATSGAPICHGVYTDRKVAEHATKPETMWEANNCPPKFVLPFRLGWKFDRYFPDGKPWPPDQL